MANDWRAHSLPTDPDRSRWQPLAEHLLNVSKLSRERAEKFGAARAAALAGILHDLGKYTREFQARLEGGARVDHATAGARVIVELAATAEDRCMAEVIAHAIAGHHAGLPDSLGDETSLDGRRKNKRLPALDPAWRTEISPIAEGLTPEFLGASKPTYSLSFLGRMIFSCLVDADYRDTEDFYAKAKGETVDREWPRLLDHMDDYITRFDLPGVAARRLQPFIVQVPPKARDLLVRNGHVRFVEGFGDQFAVLESAGLYSRDVGLVWEDAEHLEAFVY